MCVGEAAGKQTGRVQDEGHPRGHVDESGPQRDGHGEFHGHAALGDVFDRFFENRVAADGGGGDADHAPVREGLPEMEPDRAGSGSDECDAKEIRELPRMVWDMLASIYCTGVYY